MPEWRSTPPGLGMLTRLTGCGRKALLFSSACSLAAWLDSRSGSPRSPLPRLRWGLHCNTVTVGFDLLEGLLQSRQRVDFLEELCSPFLVTQSQAQLFHLTSRFPVVLRWRFRSMVFPRKTSEGAYGALSPFLPSGGSTGLFPPFRDLASSHEDACLSYHVFPPSPPRPASFHELASVTLAPRFPLCTCHHPGHRRGALRLLRGLPQLAIRSARPKARPF